MSKRLAFATAGVVITASCSPSAYAQDLKAMLLNPVNGWVMEWNNPGTRNRGIIEAVLVDRGEGVIAKLGITAVGANSSGPINCERNVTITADTVKNDGCKDRNIVLFYDAGDAGYPFKARDKTEGGYLWRAKVK